MIVIQARMGSTRLPGKVLMQLRNKAVLRRIIDAAYGADIGPVHVAIPDTQENDTLAVQWKSLAQITRGPEHDVAARFEPIVKDAPWFVRICADSPFIDKITIRNAVDTFLHADVAVVIGGDPGRYVQVVNTEHWLAALPEMTPEEREHVVPKWLPTLPANSLTLDTPEDYARLRRIA